MPHDGKVPVVASDAEEATNETGKQRHNLPKISTAKAQLDTSHSRPLLFSVSVPQTFLDLLAREFQISRGR